MTMQTLAPHYGEDLFVRLQSGVRQLAAFRSLNDSDRKELDFWKTDAFENPNGDLFDNVVAKANFMMTFAQLAPLIDARPRQVIVELGGGHCWASAMLKRQAPHSYVIASDVSPDAVAFAARYERLLDVTIDEKWAAPANQLPFADASVDTIFAFAAFHHFIIGDRYDEVVSEMFRVLKPGGRAVLLYEPSAPPLFYGLAHRRVNNLRTIDEDVIRLDRLGEAVGHLGGDMQVSYFPEARFRPGIKQIAYYTLLAGVPMLQRLLPCTVNVTLTASK